MQHTHQAFAVFKASDFFSLCLLSLWIHVVLERRVFYLASVTHREEGRKGVIVNNSYVDSLGSCRTLLVQIPCLTP